MKFCVLASSSSGNCSVLWNDKNTVLIDVGCGVRYLQECLDEIGLNKITAAVITHAHIDHLSVSGLNYLIKNKIPVYMHKQTYADAYNKYKDKLDKLKMNFFSGNFKINDIEICPFRIYHKDANISTAFGFTFMFGIYKLGYMTDTGKVCENIINKLKDSNVLLIETNYDRQMLDWSDRPLENKKWVLSEFGHLKNEDGADAIAKIKINSTKKDSLKHVFLAHLSFHHNTPTKALDAVKKVLKKQNIDGIALHMTYRDRKCEIVEIA